jgi:hypothetical protein
MDGKEGGEVEKTGGRKESSPKRKAAEKRG